MNYKRYIRAFLAVIVASVSLSCENFLTQENPNEELLTTYFQNTNDCENALTGVYNAFKNDAIYAVPDDALRSDLAAEGGNSTNREQFDHESYLHSYTDAYTAINNRWAGIYTMIKRVNDLLAGIEDMRARGDVDPDVEEDVINLIEAQCHFMRGLAYYYLHVTYRHSTTECVPLVTRALVDPADLATPLSSPEAVRDYYRSELELAISKGLPAIWEDEEDRARVTSGAAYTVLAQSYLEEATDPNSRRAPSECYATARTFLNTAMLDGDYSFAGIADNSTTRNEFNSESVLEVSYSLEENTEQSGEKKLYNTVGMNFSRVGGYYTAAPALWLVEEFMNEDPDPKIAENWIEIAVEKDIFFNKYYYATQNNANSSKETQIRDLVFMTVGEPAIRESYVNTDDGRWKVSEAFVHEYEGVDQVTGEYIYNPDAKLRTVIYKDDMDLDDPNAIAVGGVTYTGSSVQIRNKRIVSDPQSPAVETSRFYIKKEGDKYYRRRVYSPRASYYMLLNGDIDMDYYLVPLGNNSIFGGNYGAFFRKYTNWDERTDEKIAVPANSSGINFRLLRLADIYLLYAEALIEGGSNDAGVNEALRYVNRVRRRAGAILIGSSSQSSEFSPEEATFDGDELVPQYQDAQGAMSAKELMHHLIYVERPLELCLDGYHTRILDLRRWRTDDNQGEWNMTGERFDELSSDLYEYYFDDTFLLNDANDKYTTRQNWGYQMRFSTSDIGEEYDDQQLLVDFKNAATAYNPNDYYWPIPNLEKLSNPYIY